MPVNDLSEAHACETVAVAVTSAPVVKLHLGSGEYPLDGYECFDFFASSERTTAADLRRLPLPDNYADEIYSQSLEHIPHPETLTALREWLRLLKPGGYIKLTVPDLEWTLKYWLELPESERWGFPLAVLFGLQHDETAVHYTGFTIPRIRDLVEAAGFESIECKTHWQCEQQRIWIEAKKPIEPNLTVMDSDDYQKTSLHPAAVERTRALFAQRLPDTDYNWIKRDAEYESYKKWHGEMQGAIRDYNEHVTHLWGEIHARDEKISELTKKLSE